MPDITARFAAELKSARIRAGMLQKDVAERLSVSESCISTWEKADHLPQPNRMDALCGILPALEGLRESVIAEYRALKHKPRNNELSMRGRTRRNAWITHSSFVRALRKMMTRERWGYAETAEALGVHMGIFMYWFFRGKTPYVGVVRRAVELFPEIEEMCPDIPFYLVRMTPQELGEALKERRKSAGMTGRALSDMLGISPMTISETERAVYRMPKLETLKKLAVFLKEEDVIGERDPDKRGAYKPPRRRGRPRAH